MNKERKGLQGLRPADERVIDLLLVTNRKLGLQRKEIVESLGIAWTTVYDSLGRLKRKGIVNFRTAPKVKGKVGRPGIFWFLTGFYCKLITTSV